VLCTSLQIADCCKLGAWGGGVPEQRVADASQAYGFNRALSCAWLMQVTLGRVTTFKRNGADAGSTRRRTQTGRRRRSFLERHTGQDGTSSRGAWPVTGVHVPQQPSAFSTPFSRARLRSDLVNLQCVGFRSAISSVFAATGARCTRDCPCPLPACPALSLPTFCPAHSLATGSSAFQGRRWLSSRVEGQMACALFDPCMFVQHACGHHDQDSPWTARLQTHECRMNIKKDCSSRFSFRFQPFIETVMTSFTDWQHLQNCMECEDLTFTRWH
jgi:hypothetical protein